MMTQLKYSLRHGARLRLTMLLLCLAINLGFTLAWQLGARHPAVQIVGVTLSSLSLTAVFVGNIIADVASVRDIFGSPSGYAMMLAPVKGWKILGARVLSILICDTISYAVSIVGVVFQSLLLAQMRDMGPRMTPYIGWGILFFVLYYLLIILAICFAEALRTGVLHRLPGRGILSAGLAIAALYVMSFLNLILTPFGAVDRFGLFMQINLDMSVYAGTVLFVIILLAQSAALFAATTRVIERKINL